MARIGVQLSTVRPTIQEIGLYETLRELAKIGYHSIEVSQIALSPENIEILKKAKSEFGIDVVSLTARLSAGPMGGESLENDYTMLVNLCRELGCSMLRNGSGPIYEIRSKEQILDYCRAVEPFVQRLKADGIDYFYHNHALEFAKFDGQYMLDIIRDNTSMGFELDTHWILAGGLDPVKVIKEYAGRIRLLHLKDYRIVLPEEDMGELRKKGINPQRAAVQFAEIGEGCIDMKGCIEAGISGGAEEFLIELDRTYHRTPLESLKLCYDNLTNMGFGAWM